MTKKKPTKKHNYKQMYEQMLEITDQAYTLFLNTVKSLNAANLKAHRLHEERKKAATKTHHRQEQLRLYQEKLELMKTWRGIFRTICQKFGVWK